MMEKSFKDVYNNLVTVGSKVIYNFSGVLVRGKVLDILPNYIKIELIFPEQYSIWETPFMGIKKGHISKVRNEKSILLDKN